VFGKKAWRVDCSNVPTAVFSSPEIGTVGLTELEDRARYLAVSSGATMKDFMSVMAVHPTVGEEIVAMQTPTVRYDRRDASTPVVPSAAV
jgi:pyruvate/2-oxoglutarate dehydrogenase complex dihydrolipoamide dehydrogenase (E3) component